MQSGAAVGEARPLERAQGAPADIPSRGRRTASPRRPPQPGIVSSAATHTHTHTRRTHSSVAGAPGVWRPPAGCCSRGAPIPAASSTAAGGASTEATWAPPIWPRGPPARTHARTHASALGRAGEMEHHRQNLHPLRDMSRTGISSWH